MPLKLQKGRYLSEFSTLGVGGPIHTFVQVSTPEEMFEAYQIDLPKLVIGKGSNCLFDDRGFSGLVILNKIDFCSWGDSKVTAGSGYSFSRLGAQSAKKGLSGLEFASGIPASVGGAVFMNAGANGKEVKDVLFSVEYFDGKAFCHYQRKDLEYRYRYSPFQEKAGVVISATFELKPEKLARDTQLKIIEYRKKTQPLKEKSIGCIFRNPPNHSAGALIEQSGLKGTRIGGAAVSLVHANFIINIDRASSSDIKSLIDLVQEKVLEQTGITLEPEVRMINDV